MFNINIFKFLFISIITFTFLNANTNNNVLLNPSVKEESIIDIGYNKKKIPYSASIPKSLIESQALSRKIDSYINVLKRDHKQLDCLTDDYGSTTCPEDTVECLSSVETKRGTSVRHDIHEVIDREKVSTTRGESLYPNQIIGSFRIPNNRGSISGSTFTIVAENGSTTTLSGTELFNAGWQINGKFAMKMFNFGSGCGGFSVSPTPSSVQTLVNGGASVKKQGYVNDCEQLISSWDGQYAVALVTFNSVPASLSFVCDDYCLVGDPNDIGFGFWNWGCQPGFSYNGSQCIRDYTFFTYECQVGGNIDDTIKAPIIEDYTYNTLNNPQSSGATSWGGFLSQYNISVGSYSYNFDVATTGTYRVRMQFDNYGTVSVDGNVIHSDTSDDWATEYNVSVNLSAGTHNLGIYAANYEGPYGVAIVIYDPSGNMIWNTRTGSTVHVYNKYCATGYTLFNNMCYKQYSYAEEVSPITEEQWVGPLNAGGDCRGVGLDSNNSCNSPVPPEGNCIKTEFTCPLDESLPCVKISDNSSIVKNLYSGYMFNYGITEHKSKEISANKTCSNGGTYLADKDLCVSNKGYKCPISGFEYDSVLNECIGVYACNGYFSESTGKCEVKPTVECPTGSYYDMYKQTCMANPKCDNGTLNPLTFQCEETVNCDTANGWTLDSTINSCVKELATINPICPESFMIWNPVTHICEGYANFNEWSKVSVGGDTGSWNIQNNGAQLYQNVNGDYPTFFMSSGAYSSSIIKGKMYVNDNDDDSIGIVFGFRGTNDTYVLNWVQSTASWTTGAKAMNLQKITSNGNYALAGRINYAGANIGWSKNTWYEIELRFNDTQVQVFLNGNLVITETGIDLPATSRLGFFNQSQSNVYYKDFYISTIPTCSPGYIYNKEYDICYKGTNGATIDFNNRLYIQDPFCGMNGIYDANNHKCLYNPTCFVGGYLDVLTKTCTAQETNKCYDNSTPVSGVSYEDCNISTLCPSGYTLDQNINKCVKSISNCSLIDSIRGVCYQETNSCSTGYTYSSVTSRCEMNVTCPSNGYINSRTKSCELQVTDSCINIHIQGFNQVCAKSDICPDGSSKIMTSEGYMCKSSKTLACPENYIEDPNLGKCVAASECPEGFIQKDGQCLLTYNWAEFTCEDGWEGTLIDSGKDCNASCGKDGCWCSNKVAPANNCRKAFNLTNEENTYTLTEKRPVEYHYINGKGLSEGEYGEVKNFNCGDNCTYDLVSITTHINELCFIKRNGEKACLTVDKCYFEGGFQLDKNMPLQDKIVNLQLNDSYTLKSNYNMVLKNLGNPNPSCPKDSFLGANGKCLSTICEEGFYYNSIDKICEQKIVSTCKMNGNVGWENRENGIVSVANGNTALNYVLFSVKGTEKFDNNSYWEGINIGKMAFKLSDGHWYVSSDYRDVNNNPVSRTLPDFVQKLNVNNYQIYNKGVNCYDGNKNISNYCATNFKLILPETKMSILEMIDLDSLNAQSNNVNDNTHNLEVTISDTKYNYKGTGRLESVILNSNATTVTKKIDSFVDRLDFWDSFEDGYLGYIEFLRNVKDKDREEDFIIQDKIIYELAKSGINMIDYIPSINKTIYFTNSSACNALSTKIGATPINKALLTTDQYKLLRNFGVDDFSCLLVSNDIYSFSNINWAFRKNTYDGNFTFRCSPYKCNELGNCNIATCPTEERTNPVETVEYIGTLLPPEFIPNVQNVIYCMEQKCDANLDYIDYCGYYQKCDMNNSNVFEMNGSCYEYYCNEGEVFNSETKKCMKEGCPPGTKEVSGKCVLIQ